MEGYIISFVLDSADSPISYWDGTTETSDINASHFETSLSSARQLAGNLQAQYTDRQVMISPARKVTQLINNVAAGT